MDAWRIILILVLLIPFSTFLNVNKAAQLSKWDLNEYSPLLRVLSRAENLPIDKNAHSEPTTIIPEISKISEPTGTMGHEEPFTRSSIALKKGVSCISKTTRTSPQITVIVYWPNKPGYGSGVLQFYVKIYDEDGLDVEQLFIDGELIDSHRVYGDTDEFYWYWDTTRYSDGEHTVKFWVNDTYGYSSYTTVDIIVDNTPPDLTYNVSGFLEINSTYYASGLLTFSYSLQENNLDVLRFRLYDFTDARIVMEKNISDLSGKININTTSFPDGLYYAILTVIDKAGNQIEEAWPPTTLTRETFIIDNSPPNFRYVEPSSTVYTSNDTYTVSWYAVDLAGIKQYKVSVNNGAWVELGLKTKFRVNLSKGLNIIRIAAIDLLNHENITTVKIYLDTDKPEIIVYSPKQNESLWAFGDETNVILNLTIRDNSILKYITIKLDDEVLYSNSDINDAELMITKTTKIKTGKHTLRIVVSDKAGNKSELSIYFEVANYTPYVLTPIIGVSLILAVIIARIKIKSQKSNTT